MGAQSGFGPLGLRSDLLFVKLSPAAIEELATFILSVLPEDFTLVLQAVVIKKQEITST